MNYIPDSRWAWSNFLPTVRNILEAGNCRSVMEIGGGRFPSFDKGVVEQLGVHYTSNDISARELSLAPDWVSKAHFDIQTRDPSELDDHAGRYDLIFSKMVMEHIPSYRRTYRNIARLLKPGGMAISFHPTLFALPFVVNYLAPERLTRPLLELVFPNRSDVDTPKFPAYYSGCRVSRRLREEIRAFGFASVEQVPFYSHGYYEKFPLLRGAHDRLSRVIMKLNITPLAAYCYTFVSK
jgi:SAM-dependent methyltransferase